VEVHGGSFLDDSTGIPSGADAYIMKHIIHDWDDESVFIRLSIYSFLSTKFIDRIIFLIQL
jgi:hypothetical protein